MNYIVLSSNKTFFTDLDCDYLVLYLYLYLYLYSYLYLVNKKNLLFFCNSKQEAVDFLVKNAWLNNEK